MSHNCVQRYSRSRSRSPLVIDLEGSVTDPISFQSPGTSASFSDHKDGISENENPAKPSCAICLEQCIQPIKLPCSHVFCFLCVKGVNQYNRKCPLCRTTIPEECLKNPQLLEVEQSSKDAKDEYRWFYEGIGGWWQYDDRTNAEIEDAFQKGEMQLEVMIAGCIYNVDLGNCIQARKDLPNRKRCIKRDLASISKKGVAGIKLKKLSAKNKKKATSKKGKSNSSLQQNAANLPQQSGASSSSLQRTANSPQQNGTNSASSHDPANSTQQTVTNSDSSQDTANSTQQNGTNPPLQQNGSNSFSSMFRAVVEMNIIGARKRIYVYL